MSFGTHEHEPFFAPPLLPLACLLPARLPGWKTKHRRGQCPPGLATPRARPGLDYRWKLLPNLLPNPRSPAGQLCVQNSVPSGKKSIGSPFSLQIWTCWGFQTLSDRASPLPSQSIYPASKGGVENPLTVGHLQHKSPVSPAALPICDLQGVGDWAVLREA